MVGIQRAQSTSYRCKRVHWLLADSVEPDGADIAKSRRLSGTPHLFCRHPRELPLEREWKQSKYKGLTVVAEYLLMQGPTVQYSSSALTWNPINLRRAPLWPAIYTDDGDQQKKRRRGSRATVEKGSQRRRRFCRSRIILYRVRVETAGPKIYPTFDYRERITIRSRDDVKV